MLPALFGPSSLHLRSCWLAIGQGSTIHLPDCLVENAGLVGRGLVEHRAGVGWLKKSRSTLIKDKYHSSTSLSESRCCSHPQSHSPPNPGVAIGLRPAAEPEGSNNNKLELPDLWPVWQSLCPRPLSGEQQAGQLSGSLGSSSAFPEISHLLQLLACTCSIAMDGDRDSLMKVRTTLEFRS